MHVTASPLVIAIAVVIVVLILAALIYLGVRRYNRTTSLRRRYGVLYDRSVQRFGSRRKAERELLARERNVRALSIRELTPDEREHFNERWNVVPAHFLDSPLGAVGEADELVCAVMKSRGYPATGIDDCAAGIVVNHPGVSEDYRAARRATVTTKKHAPTTEELRGALVHYRALVNELVGPPPGEARKAA